ncbi:MAG: MarR family winged helix-turn-helix transcriptional regulator [Solirubrobacteraceae bacterium]
MVSNSLRLAHVRVGELVASELPPGIPQRYHQVLQSLSDLGPRSQHELSELLHVNRTTMVELIDAMEHANLVTRRRNPSDRRSYALQLTPTGQQMLQRLTAAVDRADAQLTATLSDRERQRIQTLLEAIASAGEQPHELAACHTTETVATFA